MPLETVTVTWRATRWDGGFGDLEGEIAFRPAGGRARYTDVDGTRLIIGEITAPISDGVAILEVPASDQDGVDPSGFTWTVSERLRKDGGRGQTYPVSVVLADQDDGILLAERAPVPSTLGTSPALTRAQADAYASAFEEYATRAENAAAEAEAPTDAAIAALAGAPTSLARGALDAIYASKPVTGPHPLTGYFHLDGYGGIPDGVTNCQSAILAARTDAAAYAAATGRQATILARYTPQGWSASALAFSSNVRLLGQGRVLLRRQGASSATFINGQSGTRDAVLEGFTLDSAGLSTASSVRSSTGCLGVRVVNCDFTESTTAPPTYMAEAQTGGAIELVGCRAYASPITVGTGNVSLQGTGNTVTTLDAGGAPTAHGLAVDTVVQFATVTTTTGVKAGGFYFVKATPTANTLTLAAGKGGTEIDLVGDGTATGFAKANSYRNFLRLSGAIAYPKVIDCDIAGWSEHAIWAVGTSTTATFKALIQRCRVYGLIPGGTAGARQPIAFQGDDAALHTEFQILDNVVTGPGVGYDDTLVVGAADLISVHRASGGMIRGNVCTDGGDVGITIAEQSVGTMVVNNTCRRNDTVGICVGSNTSSYVRGITVTGNNCSDNGQSRSLVRPYRSGIHLNHAVSCEITGNVLGDYQTTKTQQYGYTVVNSTNDTIGGSYYGNSLGDYLVVAGAGSGPVPVVNSGIVKQSLVSA